MSRQTSFARLSAIRLSVKHDKKFLGLLAVVLCWSSTIASTFAWFQDASHSVSHVLKLFVCLLVTVRPGSS